MTSGWRWRRGPSPGIPARAGRCSSAGVSRRRRSTRSSGSASSAPSPTGYASTWCLRPNDCTTRCSGTSATTYPARTSRLTAGAAAIAPGRRPSPGRPNRPVAGTPAAAALPPRAAASAARRLWPPSPGHQHHPLHQLGEHQVDQSQCQSPIIAAGTCPRNPSSPAADDFLAPTRRADPAAAGPVACPRYRGDPSLTAHR